MNSKNSELKKKLQEIAEKCAGNLSFEKVKKEAGNVEDNFYSENFEESAEFWQAHLRFLEFNSDENGEYARFSIDISDSQKRGFFEKGSPHFPMTAGLFIYQDGNHEIYI